MCVFTFRLEIELLCRSTAPFAKTDTNMTDTVRITVILWCGCVSIIDVEKQ